VKVNSGWCRSSSMMCWLGRTPAKARSSVNLEMPARSASARTLATNSEKLSCGMALGFTPWGGYGAIAGLASVMLVMLLGQSRVLYTMSHDGLFWKWASKIHPRFRTPYITSIVVGTFVAFLAAFFPIAFLGELVSLGTLLAFTIVCLGVWIMRVKQPNVPRPFRTPFVPWVPISGMIVSLALMFSLDAPAWKAFGSWLIVGLIIYFTYSRKHSSVQRALAAKESDAEIHR